MKIYLRDRNPGMTEAWMTWFKGIEDVEISTGEIFDGPKADAIISPANSFGYMDGGIDLAYSKKFGWDLSKRLQIQLNKEHYGELPVGQAVIISTKNEDYPWLISAPTMRVPASVANTVNAYLAFRASLEAVKDHNLWSEASVHDMEIETGQKTIQSILCPGLGTAVGQMPFNVCAKQMFYAYMLIIQNKRKDFSSLGECVNNHYSLARDF